MIASAAALRRTLLIPLCLAFLAAFTGTAEAARRVVFSPLVAGPDFDDAMAFFASYLDPADYDTRDSVGAFRAARKLGNTLDLYLREFVLVGKGDVNDDGVEETFYYFDDSDWCGSAGCSTILVQKRKSGALQILCEFKFFPTPTLWISDWVSPGDYREILTRFRVYWRKGECHDDDPEIMPLTPPPLRPNWKPIK